MFVFQGLPVFVPSCS